MNNRLRQLTDWLGRWPIVAILALPTLVLFCLFNFYPAMVPNLLKASAGVPPLDMQLGYGPEDVQSLLSSYGVEGRQRYAQFLVADLAFAVCYGLWLAGLLRLLLRPLVSSDSRWNDLCLLPLLAGAADLGENLSILAMLHLYPAVPHGLAYAASGLTLAKWSMAAAGIASIFVAIGMRLVLRMNLRRRSDGGLP
jgi:hypothetical protein